MKVLRKYPRLSEILPGLEKIKDVEITASESSLEADYLVLTARGDEEGGQFLVRLGKADGTGDALLHSDTLVFPLPSPADSAHAIPLEIEKSLASQTAGRLLPKLDGHQREIFAESLRTGRPAHDSRRGLFDWLQNIFDRDEEAPPAAAPAPISGDGVNARLLAAAKESLSMDTSAGPDGGNLACVWAVNKVFRKAFGRSLTSTAATAVLDDELEESKGELVSEQRAKPGNIIISPTGTGIGHGHVGILGEDGKIYSNSSGSARWKQNFTVASWKQRYGVEKQMPVRFYQVKPAVAGVQHRSLAEGTRTLSLNAPQPTVTVSGTSRALSLTSPQAEEFRVPVAPSRPSEPVEYDRMQGRIREQVDASDKALQGIRALLAEGSALQALAEAESADQARAQDSTSHVALPMHLIEKEDERWRRLQDEITDELRWETASHEADALSSRGERLDPPTLPEKRAEYEALFASCVIRASKLGDVAWYRQRILNGRGRYQALSSEFPNIPWYFVAILHAMECSCSFAKHLHNGDPLTGRTVRVPRGRPRAEDGFGSPPYSWEASARDALTMPGKQFHLQLDWSVAAMLYRFEKYNGWGYHWRDMNSPYLWSFSNHYVRGKFVSDGVFDPNAVSAQAGAAVLLKDLINRGIVEV